MPEINRQALGLLDFLQVQAGGRNPDTLSESLRGVIEVYPFYEPDRLRVRFNGFSLSPGGQTASFTVPEKEYWLVVTLGYIMNVDAGDLNNLAFLHGGISDAGGGAAAPWVGQNELQAGVTQAGSGTRTACATKNFERPRLLTPDQTIELLNCNSDTVPTVGSAWVTYVLIGD